MEKVSKTGIEGFYLKTFLTGWGVCCVVWLFMLVQFWWGNHDWGYLKSGTDINSGLFEARYSQHLPTFFLFDGHILPFLTLFSSVTFLVLEAILIAVYLDIPKVFKNYLFFIFLVALNPYTATLFYFLYLSFVYVFWSLVGVILLFLAEQRYKWYKLLVGGFLFFLILGSYPPNIALILVLFVTKRLLQYLDENETFRVILAKGLYFLLMLGLGYMAFIATYKFILDSGKISITMYNIAVRSVFDIGDSLLNEAGGSIMQLFHQHSFMEFSYVFLLSMLVISAVFMVFSYKKNKIILGLFVFGIFLASRFCFIVGEDVSAGVFRIEYWSRLGVAIFALTILLNIRSDFIKNCLLVWFCCVVILFMRRDFEIQKVRYFEFAANRKYQTRYVDEIVINSAFEMKPKYISLNFGYPRFYPKYMKEENRSGDIAGIMPVFDFDGVNQLFWEEKISPVVVGAAVWGENNVFKASRGEEILWGDRNYWQNNPKNMENIRYWLYTDAKYGKAYVDDKYIITVFDKDYFYKYRETVINHLDD